MTEDLEGGNDQVNPDSLIGAGDGPAGEKYDLKLPEGSLLPSSRIDEIVSYARERGLSNEVAQEILDREDEAVWSFQEGQQRYLSEINERWIEETRTDREIAGADGKDYESNIRIAAETVARFDPEGKIKEMMNRSGLGNHPEVIKLFLRIGKAMKDARFIHPGTQSRSERSLEEILYGGTKGG